MASAIQADEIQRRMEQVRNNLAQDVHRLVERARETTDWRYHVRRHPWLCLGVAAAAGYLVVPQKKQVVVSGIENNGKNGKAVNQAGGLNGLSSALTTVMIRTLANALIGRGVEFLQQRKSGQSSATAGPAPANPYDAAVSSAHTTETGAKPC